MELTARMEYATLALVEMAVRQSNGNGAGKANRERAPLQAAAIAERQGIPRPYLDQLLLLLRRAGLVTSIRGPKGGHLLAKPASEVTLREVFLALEGDGSGRAGRRRREQGPGGVDPGLVAAWTEARERFLAVLGDRTIDALAARVRRKGDDGMYFI